MNPNQYVLIGSTTKAYLSYLIEQGMLMYDFKDNKPNNLKINYNYITNEKNLRTNYLIVMMNIF